MAIDRNIWLKSFTETSLHPYPCPRCKTGVLTFKERPQNGVGSPSMQAETAESAKMSEVVGYSPFDEEGLFGYVLVCQRQQCREIAVVCGKSGIGVEYEDGGQIYVTEFYPVFFHPAPHIFHLPHKCPEGIAAEVRAAFRLYWCDPSSCVNRIRTAVELFLTSQGHPRFDRKNGKMRRMPLHERIVKLQATNPDLAESLMAIKWLGNAGSHPGDMSKDDALDGFELLEHVLEECYAPRKQLICKIRKGINRRKGPRSK